MFLKVDLSSSKMSNFLHFYLDFSSPCISIFLKSLPSVDRCSLIVKRFTPVVDILKNLLLICQIFMFKFHGRFRRVSERFLEVPGGFQVDLKNISEELQGVSRLPRGFRKDSE